MLPTPSPPNFELFRECLSIPLISAFSPPNPKPLRKHKRNSTPNLAATKGIADLEIEKTGIDDFAEFIDYLASEIFTSLPTELQTLSYNEFTSSPTLKERYDLPLSRSTAEDISATLPLSVLDSLTTYASSSSPSLSDFLYPILTAYLTALLHPPLTPAQSKQVTTACEICERDWVPLTYHHLIPRAVHAKAVKRGWRKEEDLANVAWLCRACHSFVHSIAGHEVLAREFYTVELLMEREDVRKFSTWVGRVRYKAR